MASTIFYNGRVISVPGAYSEVDATGLEQVGLGASGIVALIGTAEGGIPVGSITKLSEYIRLNKPEAPRSVFRSGDLREACGMAFEPSSDAQIQAGAQEIIAMKVNPAVQSAVTLSNAQGAAIDLTSEDYGAFTQQVNVSIATGTTKGKLVTIIFEDVTEAVDDLGGDDIFNLTYDQTTNALGWDTMTSQINAGGVLQADGTRAGTGKDSNVTDLLAQGAARVVSANAGDTTQSITLYGLDASGDPASEQLDLNGTTPVNGTQVWGAGDLLGAVVSGTTLGAIAVSDQVIPTTVMTVPLGADQSQGLVVAVGMFIGGGKITLVSSGASTKDIVLEGTNLLGATVLEKITLTGVVSVVSVGDYTKITNIIMGDVEVAQTITASAVALLSTAAVHTSVQQLADYVNARTESGDGFELVLVTGQTGFLNTNLDVSVSAVNIDSPANPGFTADVYAVVDWININSSLVTAVLASGVTGGALTNTTAPVFLSGGSEGVATSSDWQSALNLLKQVRVNTVVVLTGDSAVHAAQDAHCAYMGGIGRSERDCLAGLQNAGLTDVPTKTEAKTQIIDLNSRHTRAVAQAIDRYNIAGVRTRFQPPFAAVIAAGMQAGSSVGVSLTHKQPNVLSFDQDTTWNPADDAEEMIQGGLLLMENVDGTGRQWVRNVTTHLSTNNLAYIEGSVNEAANYAVFTFRSAMEVAVGRIGFSGTVNGATGIAIKELGLLVDANILVRHRSLNIELAADVLEIGVEMAPGIPINFVKNNIHLVIAS